MGKKIPGKRHRTIKDPYKQAEQRNKKKQFNCKPKNDDQEVFSTVQNIHKGDEESSFPTPNLKKKMKAKNKLLDTAKFLRNNTQEQYGMTKKLKVLPTVKQRKGESDDNYMRRVNAVTHNIIKESQYEDKYNVEVIRNKKGVITNVNKREYSDPLLQDKIQKIQQNRTIKNKKRMEKLKLKKKGKRSKNEEEDNALIKEFQMDNVEFGDIVHEPPNLRTEKIDKLAKKVNANKETEKINGFLFMKKINSNKTKEEEPHVAIRKQIMEEERIKAVELYRQLKAKNSKWSLNS